MELTFLQFCKEIVQLEPVKNLLDMLLMGFHVLRVDEDVIKVHNNTDIQHVSEDGIDKLLECCRSINDEVHDQPFIRPIVSAECSLPLIPWSNPDEMVCMLEVHI